MLTNIKHILEQNYPLGFQKLENETGKCKKNADRKCTCIHSTLFNVSDIHSDPSDLLSAHLHEEDGYLSVQPRVKTSSSSPQLQIHNHSCIFGNIQHLSFDEAIADFVQKYN